MISRHPTEQEGNAQVATQSDNGATPDVDAPPALDLLPGVRARLNERLDHAGIPHRGRLTYVAALTYRAVQTVSRWFEPERPGLPDVESLARLCDGLGCSSDWVLGLTPAMGGNPALQHASATELQWVGEVLERLRRMHRDSEPMPMVGDEMAPSIHDGDMLFVDRRYDRLGGNGVYALEINGRVLVRRVENRMGTGIVFKCDNPAYDDYPVADVDAVKRMGLRVLGKVHAAVGVTVFWNS